MNNWLKKLKVKAILPAAALLAAAAIGTTFAWQTWNVGLTNELKSHITGVELKEEFTPYKNKDVWFVNTGTSSVFLRVSYGETWRNGDILLSNKVKGADVATKVWHGTTGPVPNPDLWWDGGDGWYYYKKVLKAEETEDYYKQTQILDNVTFENLPPQYSNADYELYFKVEVVQCSDGSATLNKEEVNRAATKELFGKTAVVESDGISVAWSH